ncbi:MAG TPA: tetratricopeptide repeat protein [Ignavibacteria bacterium]|nr:tetratricopeptide repeat protein [Ignavibacteria bacterium]
MRIFKYSVTFFLLSGIILFSQEKNLSNMFRLAKSFEQSGQYEEAKTIYKNIYNQQPWNHSYLEALNNIYIQLKEYDEAIDLISGNIKLNPDNIGLYGILGSTYYTKGDTLKAFQTWEDGLSLTHNSVSSYRIIVNYALENRAFKKAIEYLKRGKELTDNTDIFSLDLARIYAMTMSFEKAAIEYCEIIKNDPNKTPMVIGNMISFLSRPNALLETIAAVRSFNETNNITEINRVLIQLHQLNNDYGSAFEYVVKLESQTKSNGSELYRFAQEALRQNKFDIASKAFNKVIEEYPKSPLVPQSQIGYARTFEQTLNSKRDSVIENWKPIYKTKVVFVDDYKKAIDLYQQIINKYPGIEIKSESVLRIAEIYFKKLNELDTASHFYNNILSTNGISQFHYEAKLRLAEINAIKGDLVYAENLLLDVSKNRKLPEYINSQINLLLGKVYFWEGNFESASEKLSNVTQNLSDDNANDALQLLALIRILKSDSLTLAEYSKADFMIYKKNFSGAAELLNELRVKKNPIVSEFSAFKYAQVLIAEEQYTAAIKTLSSIIEESSLQMFNAEMQYLLGEIKFFALKDYDGALAEYRKILENYSNSLYFDKSRQKIEYINQYKNRPI